MNQLQIRSNLTLNLDKMSILLFDQEIGYLTSSIYDKKETLEIFIEEEYRFHHYALDTLKKYINYSFKNNNVEIIEFFIDADNRPFLNLIGHFNCNYVTFDEESNEHIYFINNIDFYKKKDKYEVFDTYDENLNNLNIDYIRGEHYPLGNYHVANMIILVNEKKEILITLRDPNKKYPLCYEIPGGSTLKGESFEEGAIREVNEETGIELKKEDLKLFGKYKSEDCICTGYVGFYRTSENTITLQEGETIDYTFVSFEEFATLVENIHFNPICRKVINSFKKEINEILQIRNAN